MAYENYQKRNRNNGNDSKRVDSHDGNERRNNNERRGNHQNKKKYNGMSRKEIQKAVSWILRDNIGTYGQNMHRVMKELEGKADVNIVRQTVRAYENFELE